MRLIYDSVGTGIFSVDGVQWEYARALLRPQFVREQVGDLDLEETHVQNMMKALPVDPASGWTKNTDLSTLFFRLTLDSATEFLCGKMVQHQRNLRRSASHQMPPDQWIPKPLRKTLNCVSAT